MQVALVLHLLCALGVDEIASAFLVSPAAMYKRIERGKVALAASNRLFELTAEDFAPRLSAVQRALYLLFNEGYHGASSEAAVRVDLCQEAMRLVRLLVEHAPAATPATCALAALMWLHAGRLPGRIGEDGHLKALFEQDRSRWDGDLIAEGMGLLARSAAGETLSEYHVEAEIAALHAAAASTRETRWADIVARYDLLMTLRPSPVVALNRAIALAEHAGAEHGLAAIRAIEDAERLRGYPFYRAALGELELRLDRVDPAREHFSAAKRLARNDSERRYLEQRIRQCERGKVS